MLYLSDFKNLGINNKDTFPSTRIVRRYHEKVKSNKRENTSILFYFYKLLDEYCQCSSLHGLRYIRLTSIPRHERFLWLGIFVTCLSLSVIVVKNAYLTSMNNEFQLVFEPRSLSIANIPFPAVLVCSNNPVRKSFYDLDSKKYNNKFRYFSKFVCLKNIHTFTDEVNITIDEEFFDFLFDAAIPCQKLITNCYWRSKKTDCCRLFKPIVTSYGLCYVFNSLPGEILVRHYRPMPGEISYDENLLYWDLEKGYPQELRHNSLLRPFRSRVRGIASGLTFDIVDHREEWQEQCSGPYSGFKAFVHSPGGFSETEAFMRIPIGEHSHIKLTPFLISADESLRSVDITDRECLFQDEIQLEYFNSYSESACQVECFTKTSMRICGCMPFNALRIIGRYGYPYCTDSSLRCLQSIYDNVSDTILNEREDISDVRRDCYCIPGCSWLNFELESSFQKFGKVRNIFGSIRLKNNTQYDDLARLSVYFNVDQFNVISRVRVSDMRDTVANCGGLLGLLLGFSFMSFFEVIYFFILKPATKMINLLVANIVSRYK